MNKAVWLVLALIVVPVAFGEVFLDDPDLLLYLAMNESSGRLNDYKETGTPYHFDVFSGTPDYQQAGIFWTDYSVGFDEATGEQFNSTALNTVLEANYADFTIAIIHSPDFTTDERRFLFTSRFEAAGWVGFSMAYEENVGTGCTNGGLQYSVIDGSWTCIEGSEVDGGTYCDILAYDGTDLTAYSNETLIDTKTGSIATGSKMVTLGGRYWSGTAGDDYYDGNVGAVAVWNRSLTSGEMTQWCTAGWESSGGGTVSFIAPTPPDGTKNNSQVTIAFNSSSGFADFFFGSTNPPTTQYFDNVSTGAAGYSWLTNVTSDGTYYYYACVAGDCLINTSVRSWIYDTTDPTITLNPSNSFNASNRTHNKYSDLLNLNISLVDNIELFGFSVNVTKDGVVYFNYTNESLSGTTFSFVRSMNVSSWPVGNYSVDLLGSDAHTARLIGDYEVEKAIGRLEFRTEEGNVISVSTKDAAVLDASRAGLDRYNFEVTFLDGVRKQRVFDVVAEDGKKIFYERDSGFKAHFVVWNPLTKRGNWIDFEGVLGVPVVERVSDSHYRVVYSALDGGRELVFNSIGGLNVNEVNYLWEHSSVVVSASIVPAQANPNDDLLGYCRGVEGLGYDVGFNWSWYVNDSFLSAGSDSFFGSNVSVNVDNISSSMVHAGANWTFSCAAFSVYDTGIYQTAYVNSSTLGVSELVVDVCGVGEAVYPILNMTYFDVVSGSAITLSNGVDLSFYDGLSTYTVTKVFTGNVSDSVCSNVDPDNRTYSWDMWGTLNLQKDGYATRLWVISELDPYNVSNSPVYELPIGMIALNDSSTVNYNWYTTAFQPIDGIMYVYECEQDGSRTLVESEPITDSHAVANIELLNTPYSYEVFYGGEVYADLSGFSQCHLEAQTELTYYVDVSDTDYGSQIGLYSIECVLSQVGQVVNLSWSANPEDTSTITGCLLGYRGSVSGQTLIYQNCTSSEFSILRTIPNNTYSYYVKGKLYQSGYSLECPQITYFPATSTAQDSFGLMAVLGVVILVMSLILIYSSDGEGALVAGVVGVLVGALLGVTKISWEVWVSICAILLIVAAVGRSVRR